MTATDGDDSDGRRSNPVAGGLWTPSKATAGPLTEWELMWLSWLDCAGRLTRLRSGIASEVVWLFTLVLLVFSPSGSFPAWRARGVRAFGVGAAPERRPGGMRAAPDRNDRRPRPPRGAISDRRARDAFVKRLRGLEATPVQEHHGWAP